jgi:calreticulin
MVRNPDYKGEWHPEIIRNPNYRGKWEPPLVEQHADKDPTFGKYPALSYIGLEFFQNVPNTIFDNFLVTDDEDYARSVLEEVFLSIREAEVKNFDVQNDRYRKEHEIEDLRRDQHMDKDHDMDRFSDEESETDKNYFDQRRKKAKTLKKGEDSKLGQFDDL